MMSLFHNFNDVLISQFFIKYIYKNIQIVTNDL